MVKKIQCVRTSGIVHWGKSLAECILWSIFPLSHGILSPEIVLLETRISLENLIKILHNREIRFPVLLGMTFTRVGRNIFPKMGNSRSHSQEKEKFKIAKETSSWNVMGVIYLCSNRCGLYRISV
ncbi:hypothetical protein KIL84_014629 [Mauremys mutica]|uniref:Uncharacterized protein n=1 Tax=Mauremys mutica TaxID=74926 RepID=A0A9D3XRF2_9SAUR|nr:hypothetical protein KIL84_014629 [Mauremys mutica]